MNYNNKDLIKKAKDYLNQIYYLRQDIENNEQELEFITARINKCTSVLDGMPKAKKVYYDDALAEYSDLSREIREAISNYKEKKNSIEASILLLENRKLQDILIKKYINNNTFEEIANLINISDRHVGRLHSKALLLLGEKKGWL